MEVTRTLVKSPPELWAELSDVAALARHLGEFGTIRIVRTEPESVVEWEGDRASGSVRLEPAGWGTRVTLTAEPVAAEKLPEEPPAAEPAADESTPQPPVATESPSSEPVLDGVARAVSETPAAAPPRRRGFWARLFRRRTPEAPHPVAPPPEPPPPPPVPLPEPPPPPPPAAVAPPLDEAAVLAQALHALGSAHHRPFSR